MDVMKTIGVTLLIILCFLSILYGKDAAGKDSVNVDTADGESGYRIDQPGTITFTVAVKISGKVEKPQVMIFLPKEKTLYREMIFNRSFKKEIEEPLHMFSTTD